MYRFLYSLIVTIAVFSILSSQNKTIEVRYGDNIQDVINKSLDGDTILIYEGDYRAVPQSFVEFECGNCIDSSTEVTATYGFIVDGKSLTIIGKNPFKTRIITNAGYGFLFLNSKNSTIANLTITGGKRDRDPNATDGGIVVKKSVLKIKNVNIKDNDNTLPDIIVGICGIVGRENSEIIVEKCVIRNNSWDGIALYRGSKAIIIDNIIEQGRGVGIGITWDSKAIVYNNSVSYYWKGIGTFGKAYANVQNNLVFENLGWGVVISGASYMELFNNVIDKNGNCGVALWDSSAQGKIYNNIISNNGWRDEWVCPQVGFWMNGTTQNLDFHHNNVVNNIMGDYRNIENLTGNDGNVSVEPEFDQNYKLPDNSPLLNLGYSQEKSGSFKRKPIGRK